MSDTLQKNTITSLSNQNEVENKKFTQQQHYSLNSQALISLESQQTEHYLISDRVIGKEFLQHQNGTQQNQLIGKRNQTQLQNGQNAKLSANEDYINILEDKQNQNQREYQQQKLNTSSQIAHQLIGEDEQIEIIEDEEENDQNYQQNMNGQQQAIQIKQLEQQNDLMVKQLYNQKDSINEFTENKQFNPSQDYQKINYPSFNENGIQLGDKYQQKLKYNEENKTKDSQFKDLENRISRGNTYSGNNTNGQRLWSIVRRDIFYPIKFHGKIEIGLHKKRKMKFKGSQSQLIFSQGPFIFIDPYGRFKTIWDLIIGIIQLYFPLILPIRICFGIPNQSFIIYDMILDFIFFLDMVFSCITGINEAGEIIKDRYYITSRYLKSFFFWDLICVIPYYFFEMELCYLKILRLARYWERYLFVLNKTIYFIFKGGSSHKFAVLFYYLFKVSSLILICVHVMACWWIEVGTMPDYGEVSDLPDQFIQKGWVTLYYEKNPNKPQYREVNKDVYITSYYFVTTTIATVGYGDVQSKTVLENFFSMFCEFFGIALFGYISGGLVSAVKISLLVGSQKKNEQKSEFDQWLYQREKNQQLPLFSFLLKNLRQINHFNYENNFSEFFHDSHYFHHLPKEQKRKVFNLIFTDIATFFGAFFRNISELSMIQDMFQYMHPLTFLPGGEIIKYRSQSRGIYFIVQGKVYIKNGMSKKKTKQQQSENSSFFQKFVLPKTKNQYQDKEHFRKLKPGSFFGEFCLLEKNSAFSFVAGGKQPLNTLFITKNKLQEICQKYQETNSWLKKFSYYRFKYFNMEKYNFQKKMNIFSKNSKSRRISQQKSKNNKLVAAKSIFSRNNKVETLQNKDEINQNEEEFNQNQEINHQIQNTSSLHQDNKNQNQKSQIQNEDIQNQENLQNNEIFQNQFDFTIDDYQTIQENNIEEENQDDSINQEENNDLSMQKENRFDQISILQQNKNNHTKNGVIQIKNNNQSFQKQNLLELIEKSEEINLRSSQQNLNNKRKGNKSDLEFFLQLDPNDYQDQKLKKHIRQQSCQPQFLSQNKHLHLQNQIQQNVKKQKFDNKINSKRAQTQTDSKYQIDKEFLKNFENKNKEFKNKVIPEKIKHERHHKHLSLNNANGSQNNKNDTASSNFQSLQLSEFQEFGQNNEQFNQFYQNLGIIGSQVNINQPYQFDCHARGLNMIVLSPVSKENDRLISTPFSSNQQTHTKDTINNQRLLFSDDYQNSIKNNIDNYNQQIKKNNEKNQFKDSQQSFEARESSEKQFSCVIDMDDKNIQENDLEINNQFNHNKKQNFQFQFNFNLKDHQKNLICLNQNYQGVFNQIEQRDINQSLQDIQINKTDFNQQNKSQIDQQSQQGIFISILEQSETQSKQDDQNKSVINLEYQYSSDQQKNFKEDNINLNNIDKNENLQINSEDNEQVIQQLNIQKQQTISKNYEEISSDQKSENQPITDLIKFDSENFLSFLDDDFDSIQNQNSNKIDLSNINDNYQNEQQDEIIEDMKSDQVEEDILQNQNEQEKLSNFSSSDEMDSDEERELESKVTSKQVSIQRNESVQQIILIKEEEKKIRRAFRYLTNSNNKIEMRHTKKQLQIAEQIGVKIPFVDQLSKSRFKKQAQHKVMRKILNKKIQILVSTVLEKHNSEKMYSAAGTPSNKQYKNANFSSYHQNNNSQFEQIMKTTSLSNSQTNTSKSQKDQRFISFNQAVSQGSSSSSNRQIQDLKQCMSVYQSNSPSNNINQLSINSQKFSSPTLINQESTLPKNISFLKSKFSTNSDNRSPKQNSPQNKIPTKSIWKEASPKFAQSTSLKQNGHNDQEDNRKDIINEDENESVDENESINEIDEISDEQQTLNESDDNIELQINKIQSSRVPNFQLMIYIEKMISQHKQEYLYSSDLFQQDDYQCYEEIESLEKGKINLIKQQQGLDNSFDIPIDIIKPNFEIEELFNLPSYLDNQLSILENKMQKIVEFTYEECNSCLDKIKKLAKIKEKKFLFMGAKDETETYINQDNLSHIQTRDHVNTTNQQKITISNIMISQPLNINHNKLIQQSIKVDNGVSNINSNTKQMLNSQSVEPVEDDSGRVNLGHNIQFALINEKNSPQKDEYNFFTEIEKKNQILLQHNSSINLEGGYEHQTLPNIKSLSNIHTSKKQQSNNIIEDELKEQINSRRISDVNFRINPSSKDFCHLTKQRRSKYAENKSSSKEHNCPAISEQQKIKNEFQKMFMNLRSNTSPTNVNNSFDYSSQKFY